MPQLPPPPRLLLAGSCARSVASRRSASWSLSPPVERPSSLSRARSILTVREATCSSTLWVGIVGGSKGQRQVQRRCSGRVGAASHSPGDPARVGPRAGLPADRLSTPRAPSRSVRPCRAPGGHGYHHRALALSSPRRRGPGGRGATGWGLGRGGDHRPGSQRQVHHPPGSHPLGLPSCWVGNSGLAPTATCLIRRCCTATLGIRPMAGRL